MQTCGSCTLSRGIMQRPDLLHLQVFKKNMELNYKENCLKVFLYEQRGYCTRECFLNKHSIFQWFTPHEEKHYFSHILHFKADPFRWRAMVVITILSPDWSKTCFTECNSQEFWQQWKWEYLFFWCNNLYCSLLSFHNAECRGFSAQDVLGDFYKASSTQKEEYKAERMERKL